MADRTHTHDEACQGAHPAGGGSHLKQTVGEVREHRVVPAEASRCMRSRDPGSRYDR